MLSYKCQVGVRKESGTKNLAKSGKTAMKAWSEQTSPRTTPLQSQQKIKPPESAYKGKIIEYSFWLLKQGYAKSTITGRTKLLKILTKRGANLLDSESMKEIIAKQEWSAGRKANAVDAYTCFLRMLGGSWDPPKYKRIRKLPFIPTENEVDQLIAGCGNKTATLLQLLKETGMRVGEAWKIHWTEIDFVSDTIRVTPEKGSNPRIFKISDKLMGMLKALQEKSKSNRVFEKSLKKPS